MPYVDNEMLLRCLRWRSRIEYLELLLRDKKRILFFKEEIANSIKDIDAALNKLEDWLEGEDNV